MLARSIILRFTIVAVSQVAALIAQPEGKLACSNGDGTFDENKQPEFFGYPTFKELKISRAPSSSLPLLEATVISTNTGGPVQGAQIFLQYGKSKPTMLAISDADGKVKMRIQMTLEGYQMDDKQQLTKTRPEELAKIYIEDPNSKGNFTRIFSVPQIQESQKGEQAAPSDGDKPSS